MNGQVDRCIDINGDVDGGTERVLDSFEFLVANQRLHRPLCPFVPPLVVKSEQRLPFATYGCEFWRNLCFH